MKTFIISLITFLIIIIAITGYVFYLKFAIDDLSTHADNILYASNNKDNKTISENYNELIKKWNKKIKIVEIFTNHNKTDGISQLLSEIKNDIEADDMEQLKINVDKLKLSLRFLFDDELPTVENII